MHLIVDVIVSVDCFLCNLSEEKKILKPEIDLLNFIVVDVIVSVDTYLQQQKNLHQYFDPHTTEDKVRIIIIKARRVKKEVGERSKLKQPNKIVTKNRKTGTHNLINYF